MIGFGVWFAFGKGRSFFNSMEEKEKNQAEQNNGGVELKTYQQGIQTEPCYFVDISPGAII